MYKASIVIPLLNQKDEWLKQCVISALDQTVYTEVIVVISPFTKRSNIEVLQSLDSQYNNLVVFERAKGKKFAGAINEGFDASTAPRVGLLLSDDWLESSAVCECMSIDADLVCTGLTGYAADGKAVIEEVSCTVTMEDFTKKESLFKKARYLEHFFFFRKGKFFEVGGVDENIGDCAVDDLDLIWTLLENNATIGIVERRLYNHRDHNEERLTTRNKEEHVSTIGRIMGKHGMNETEIKEFFSARPWYGKTELDSYKERNK